MMKWSPLFLRIGGNSLQDNDQPIQRVVDARRVSIEVFSINLSVSIKL